MSDAPMWFVVALGLMLFSFGVFVGYAIAAYGDLRRINTKLDEMERAGEEGSWG